MDSSIRNSLLENHLLAALPQAELERLAPYFIEVSLSLGQILHEPQEKIETVYFPTHSMISLVSIMEDGSTVEVGIVGNDGMLGYPVYLGGDYSHTRAIVQIEGTALQLDAGVLKCEFNQGNFLQRLLLLYTQAFLAQVSQTAACNRFHPAEERLARWLLQSQDFAGSEKLNLTQEFLSSMLGIRRASVTVSAGTLQQAGMIRYNRGKITILDRAALEATTCECYQIVRREYNRLLGLLTV
ncbi:Crp/Fnr family transcriptional regulator [Capilliphycus salinus ALCB114379]|uniref:Crp/Fnr family transcriptional regulator n=1 Tax=Capilliphycus salinus TaxID=2768948 RepID=UPI0039A529C1